MTLAHRTRPRRASGAAAKKRADGADAAEARRNRQPCSARMLTFKRLLAQTKSRRARQALLAGKVEDMINTWVRARCVLFVRSATQSIRAGNGELTAERIGEIWLSGAAGRELGPAIDDPPGL